MTEEEYERLTTERGDDVAQRNIGKNKILVQALDNSGSMAGAPIDALRIGAQLIGERFYGAEPRPFEQFHTFTYNENAVGFQEDTKAGYEQRLRNIRAGAGTNFMSAFRLIENLITANPNLEELVVIFITDGQDGYRHQHEYQAMSERIKAKPGLRSRFLSVGLSRDHDAVFMNRIANFGSEQGNFTFIDSRLEGWREKMSQSLLDSLEIALESFSKVRFAIKNEAEGHAEEVKAEIQYVKQNNQNQTERDQQPQQEEIQEEIKSVVEENDVNMEEENIFDILISYQGVIRQSILTDQLRLKLITQAGGEEDLSIDFETVQEPKPQLMIKAKLQFAKRRVFDCIQELQKKGQQERQAIYQQVKQIDSQIEQD